MYIEISARQLTEIKIFAKTLLSYISISLVGVSIFYLIK